MTDVAADGNTVNIKYVGRLEDGTVFDQTEGENTLQFIIGNGELIAGVNDAVKEMAIGEKKTVTLKPDQAYGKRNDKLIGKVPLTEIPNEISIGDILSDEKENQWQVIEKDTEYAVLDGNHPLAGRSLEYDIEVISIS